MLDGSDFPKPGVQSAGVVRQYCGAVLWSIGEDCQLPGWGVPGPGGAQGPGAGGQAAVSAPGVDWGRGPLRGGGGASAPTGVPKQDGVGLGDGGGSPGQRIPQGPVGGWRFRFRDVADAAGGPGVGGNVLRFGPASGYDGVAAGTHLDRSALPPIRLTRVTGVPANPDRGVRSGGPCRSAVRRCRRMPGES